MNICDKSLCTGCSVCADICPKQCIEIKYDSDGFLHSFANESNCINCNRCIFVCPVNNPNNNNNISKVYKIRRKDYENALTSTSGGIAALVSEIIVKNCGKVVGCEFDKNLIPKHSVACDSLKLEKFKGSKYVQSRTRGIYCEIEKLLDDGDTVLFTGTPCQVSALNNYLKKPYDNLYTIDLVCHGVSSQNVLNKYIEYIEKEINEKIVNVKFRSKEDGYKNCSQNSCIFVHEKGTYHVPYNEGMVLWFASGLSLRNSCYKCNFVSTKRCSDVTLSDYNGQDLSEDDKKYGVSFLFVNTQKGAELVEMIKDVSVMEEKDLEQSTKSCLRLHHKSDIPAARKKFFEDINKLSIDKLIKKYTKRKILPSKISLYINAIKRKIR